MTDEKLKQATLLSKKIDVLREDIRVLSSKNVNGLWISIKENYSCSSHQLSDNIIDVKMAHSFLLCAYQSALDKAISEYDLL